MRAIILTLIIGACLFFSPYASAQAPAETQKIADLRKLLPAGENRRPLLVNFWATWCGPCRVEFPDLVKLDGEFRPKGLDFVLVSVDNPTLVDTLVPEFLGQYEATMPSYLLNFWERRDKAKAIRQIAPGVPDGYPMTLLFDSRGRLVYRKTGRIDVKILRTQILKVLPKGT